jgi:hypothetical protein
MSGTGKSTALVELGRRGFRVVDTDSPTWSEWAQDEWLWREDRIADLLAAGDERPLFVSGCMSNQGKFYDRFDAVVLLSAPAESSSTGSSAGRRTTTARRPPSARSSSITSSPSSRGYGRRARTRSTRAGRSRRSSTRWSGSLGPACSEDEPFGPFARRRFGASLAWFWLKEDE